MCYVVLNFQKPILVNLINVKYFDETELLHIILGSVVKNRMTEFSEFLLYIFRIFYVYFSL